MPQTSCPSCGREFDFGQAELNRRAIESLPMGNQNTKWNVIRWQAVKGAAVFYEVVDWTSKVDPSLSYEENISLMAKHGTNVEANGGPTMREMPREWKQRRRS
jgi:hypothetical protein